MARRSANKLATEMTRAAEDMVARVTTIIKLITWPVANLPDDENRSTLGKALSQNCFHNIEALDDEVALL